MKYDISFILLDLKPITLIRKLDLDMVKMYLNSENKVSSFRSLKLQPKQTDRHTHTHIHTLKHRYIHRETDRPE